MWVLASMKWIRGIYRIFFALFALTLGGLFVILTSWLPWERNGHRISFLGLRFVARAVLRFLNVHVNSKDIARIQQFDGFIFPNHISYLDIVVLVAITPVRFLAKVEVKSWPVVGLIAGAIGCAVTYNAVNYHAVCNAKIVFVIIVEHLDTKNRASQPAMLD